MWLVEIFIYMKLLRGRQTGDSVGKLCTICAVTFEGCLTALTISLRNTWCTTLDAIFLVHLLLKIKYLHNISIVSVLVCNICQFLTTKSKRRLKFCWIVICPLWQVLNVISDSSCVTMTTHSLTCVNKCSVQVITVMTFLPLLHTFYSLVTRIPKRFTPGLFIGKQTECNIDK